MFNLSLETQGACDFPHQMFVAPRPCRREPRDRRVRGRRRLQLALRQLAAVQGLPVCQPAQPSDSAGRQHLGQLDTLSLRKQGRHRAGRPDPGAAVDDGSARGAGPARQPPRAAGSLVAPAQAAGQVLAHRSGVRRTGLAGELRRPEALPPAAADPGAAAADRRPDPVARPLRPPRRADHRIPGAAGAALLRSARREGAAGRHGRAGGARAGVRLVAVGRARRRPTHRDAGAALLRPHAVRPQPHAVGVVGDPKRRAAHLLQRRFRLLRRLQARSASASGASTWR